MNQSYVNLSAGGLVAAIIIAGLLMSPTAIVRLTDTKFVRQGLYLEVCDTSTMKCEKFK